MPFGGIESQFQTTIGGPLTTYIKTTGLREVQLKADLAAVRILAVNRELVTAMLLEIKPIVEAETPIGPGHWGFHLRYTYAIDVQVHGLQTRGYLKSPPQGYWREFGTMARYRKGSRSSRSMAIAAYRSVFSSGGEKAGMYAHHAVGAVKRFITAYYGGMAAWWRL
jgi:hypothetical protein